MRITISCILLLATLALPGAVCAGQPYLVSEAALPNIWRIEDVNGDGDALDVGERVLWASGDSGSEAFGGMQSIGPAVFAVKPDVLSVNGKIVRLVDLNGDGDALDVGEEIVWADSFAQPIDVARDSTGAFYVTDDAAKAVFRLVDNNGDGDALDTGEKTVYADSLALPFMMLPWDGDLLLADYGADEVLRLADSNGDGDALDVAEVASVMPLANVSGLHADGSGSLFVSSIMDDTVYRATDNNGDGDFLDVIEVLSYADNVYGSIDGAWNMSNYVTGGFLLADYDGFNVKLVHDVNGDGDALDVGDVTTFADGIQGPVDIIPLLENLLGDYNLDGTVDGADYTVWRDTLGQSEIPFAGADGNGNGVVDSGDFDVWVFHFGDVFPPLGSGAGSGSATIPEPGSLMLLVLAACMLLPRIRRL